MRKGDVLFVDEGGGNDKGQMMVESCFLPFSIPPLCVDSLVAI
jgi:hypothetical protein